jgi:hypothetical protein
MSTRVSTESLDHAALSAAVALVWRHPERSRELAGIMARDGWQRAAEVAAYDAQCRALNLAPWEEPPCTGRLRGDRSPAGRLLRRMLRRGVSRWDPNPLRAIAEAGAPARRAHYRPVEPAIEALIG